MTDTDDADLTHLPSVVFQAVINPTPGEHHPTMMSIGRFSVPKNSKTLEDSIPRLRNHYPELDRECPSNLPFIEDVVDIVDGDKVAFPHSPENELRLRVHAKAQVMTLVVPLSETFIPDPKSFLDIRTSRGLIPIPRADAFSKFLGIMGCLLGTSIGIDRTTHTTDDILRMYRGKTVLDLTKLDKKAMEKLGRPLRADEAIDTPEQRIGKRKNADDDDDDAVSLGSRDTNVTRATKRTVQSGLTGRKLKRQKTKDDDDASFPEASNLPAFYNQFASMTDQLGDSQDTGSVFDPPATPPPLPVNVRPIAASAPLESESSDVNEKGLYLSPREMEGLFGEEYKIICDPVLSADNSARNNTMFEVQDLNTMKYYKFPRFAIHVRHVYSDENESTYDTRSDLPESHAFRHTEPQCLIYYFYIFDPRLSVPMGLYRMIRDNTAFRKSLNDYAQLMKPAKKAIVAQPGKIDDTTAVVYDPTLPENLAFLTLGSWLEWANILSCITCNSYFNDKCKKEGYPFQFRKVGNYLDPCHALNPQNLFFANKGGFKYQYASSTSYMNFRKLWTTEQFTENILSTWNNQYKKVYFYRDRFAEDDGVQSMAPPKKKGQQVQTSIPYSNREYYSLFEKDMIITVYEKPHRVVTIPIECVRGCSLMCMLFFFCMNHFYLAKEAFRPSYKIPFPMQPKEVNDTNLYAMIESAKDVFLRRATASFIFRNEPIYDTILKKYFGPPHRDMKCDRLIFSDRNKTLGQMRYQELFDMLMNFYHGNNPDLPDSISAAAGYMIAQPKETLFPDLRDPKYGFRYYPNLSIVSNFYVNMYEKYLDGAPAFCHKSHSALLLSIFVLLLAFRLRLGFQFSLFVYGDTTTGKSHIFNVLDKYAIPGTLVRQNGASGQEETSTTKKDGTCFGIDDADRSNKLLSSKQDEQGLAKTLASEGRGERHVLGQTVTGQRITLKYIVKKLATTITLCNYKWTEILPPARTRFFPLFFQGTGESTYATDNNGRSKEDDEQAHHFSIILRSMQVFSSFFGCGGAIGAMTYHNAECMFVANTVKERVLDFIHPFFTKYFWTARDNDKFNLLCYQQGVNRIWIHFVYGGFAHLHPSLKPCMDFNLDSLRMLENLGQITSTEEDALIVLSFFEDILPTKAMVGILEWILHKVRKSCQYEPGSPYHTFFENKGFFRNAAPMVATMEPSRLEPRTFDKTYDCEFLDLAFSLPGEQSKSTIIKFLEEKVMEFNPNLSKEEVNELIFKMSSETIVEVEKIHLATNLEQGDVYVGFKTIEANPGDFSNFDVQTAIPVLKTTPIKIFRESETSTKWRVVICRGWLDELVKGHDFFKEPIPGSTVGGGRSALAPGFKGSVLEEALTKYSYFHGHEQDIALIGMTLSNPLRGKHTFTQICKILPCRPPKVEPTDEKFIMKVPAALFKDTCDYPEDFKDQKFCSYISSEYDENGELEELPPVDDFYMATKVLPNRFTLRIPRGDGTYMFPDEKKDKDAIRAAVLDWYVKCAPSSIEQLTRNIWMKMIEDEGPYSKRPITGEPYMQSQLRKCTQVKNSKNVGTLKLPRAPKRAMGIRCSDFRIKFSEQPPPSSVDPNEPTLDELLDADSQFGSETNFGDETNSNNHT